MNKEKEMYKRAISWFTLGMMLVVFAGGSLILTTVGIAQEKVTVLVGGGPHLLSPRRAAKLFEQKTGIKVELVESPHKDLYVKSMTDFISGGRSYDAFQFLYTQLATFVAGGFLHPIDDYIEKYDAGPLFDDIIPSMREMYTNGGGERHTPLFAMETLTPTTTEQICLIIRRFRLTLKADMGTSCVQRAPGRNTLISRSSSTKLTT